MLKAKKINIESDNMSGCHEVTMMTLGLVEVDPPCPAVDDLQCHTAHMRLRIAHAIFISQNRSTLSYSILTNKHGIYLHGWFWNLIDSEVCAMSICNCCLSHTGFIVITDFVKLNYNFYFLCVCVYMCASLWFDNLYGDLVTFLSLRPFHLLYPLSLSSRETFIQSLFAFPLGESFFRCHLQNISSFVDHFRNCQIWSTCLSIISSISLSNVDLDWLGVMILVAAWI